MNTKTHNITVHGSPYTAWTTKQSSGPLFNIEFEDDKGEIHGFVNCRLHNNQATKKNVELWVTAMAEQIWEESWNDGSSFSELGLSLYL